MDRPDVIVVGAGISGLSFAYRTAASGNKTLLLDSAPRLGGCLDTRAGDGDFWFEVGAHTAYNSYAGFLQVIEGCGLAEQLTPREKVPFKLLKNGQLSSIMKELSLVRAILSAPRIFFTKKHDKTVEQYYSKLVGTTNYRRVLGPFLAAVPSQSADAFPATMLFKKRPRRKDVLRSFTLARGLGSIADAVNAQPNVSAKTGVNVTRVERDGAGFKVHTDGGNELTAATVAVAAPASVASQILRDAFPELADQLARIQMAHIETVGVAVDKSKLSIEPVAGIVPADDIFFSAVTRDTVPDARYRGFTFHFKNGTDRDQRLKRIAEVLGVGHEDLLHVAEKQLELPSPVLGHDDITRAIDGLIANTRLAMTGNYYAGLAIEDCVERSNTEAARVNALG